MATQKKKAEKPTFYFGKVGKSWGREFARTERQMEAEEDPEAREALLDHRDELLTEVILDIPKSWLRDDAPDGLDWSDAANLEWIQAPMYGALIEAMSEAIEEARKN